MKHRSKLLQGIPDNVFSKIMELLGEWRKKYPSYPDHELLLHMLYVYGRTGSGFGHSDE